MKVTLYENLNKVTNPFHVSFEYVLERIKNGKTRELVERVRSAGTKEERDALKKNLPCVNFQGEFKERNDNGLISFSGLMPLDYDNFHDNETLENCRSELLKSPYTFALFLSPSGNGWKQIIRVPDDAKGKYKAYFSAAQEHYNSPNFDVSSSNISRLCFESYDTDLFYNPNAEFFTDFSEPEYSELGTETPMFKITSDNRIIKNLLTWFHRKYRVASGERNTNLFKLAAALNQYGVKQSEALHTLFEFEQQGFGRAEIETICRSAYKERGEHGTRFFEDNEIRDRVEKQIRQGKSTTEIKKLIPEVNTEEIQIAADNIRSNIRVEHYLYYDDNGKVKFSPHKFKFWLEHHRFAKYFPVDSKTYTFIKIDGKIIEETNEKRIKDYVLNSLLKEDGNFSFYDFMANNTRVLTADYLSFLDSTDVKIEADTEDACFIYFKNCIVKVTNHGRETIDYFDVEGYVWKNQILSRDYIPADHHDSEYRKFVWLVSGQNHARYKSLQSVIGYLLHSFKTSGSGNRAIILNDSVISDNPNGGSGKGIFCNAISHMKKLDMLNGKYVDFSRAFSFQTVSLDCQVLVFEDVERNFNFEKLFSIITEGITIEKKGQDAIKLTIDKSPKIAITTNYTIGGTGGSHERRKFEVEFSSYFNSKHTPIDEFGHLLFYKWSEDEWNRFYNYMLECLQLYMTHGLIPAEFDNVETKKFIRNTSSDFYEWTANHDFIRFDVKLSKQEVFKQYVELYPDADRNKLSQKSFKKYLEEYCKHYPNRTYSEGNDGGGVARIGRWFMISTTKQEAETPTFNDETDFSTMF